MAEAKVDPGVLPVADFKVPVKLFGSIRAAAGESGCEISILPGATVYDLMKAISGIYGEKMSDELLDSKASTGLREDLMITVNEATINHKNASAVAIKAGDNVALYPMFLGGG